MPLVSALNHIMPYEDNKHNQKIPMKEPRWLADVHTLSILMQKSIFYIQMMYFPMIRSRQRKHNPCSCWFNNWGESFTKATPSCWANPLTTNLAFNLSTLPCALYFTLYTHLGPITFILNCLGTRVHLQLSTRACNSSFKHVTSHHAAKLPR